MTSPAVGDLAPKLAHRPQNSRAGTAQFQSPSRKSRIVVSAISAFALVLCALGWGQLALIAGVVFAALVFPAASGWLTRLTLGGTLVATWLVSVGALAGTAGLRLLPTAVAASVVGVFGPLAWVQGKGSPFARRPGDTFISCAIGLLATASVPRMVGTTQEIIVRLSTCHDNGVHFWFLASVLRAHGFAWSEHGVPGLLPTWQGYAQGESFLSGYVPWIVVGGNAAPSISQIVAFAAVMYPGKVLVLALLAMLTTRELVPPDVGRVAMLTALTAALAIVGLGLGSVLSVSGFQAQSMAMCAALAGLLALCQANAGASHASVAFAAAGSILLSAHSWLLLMPTVVAPLAWFVWRRRSDLHRAVWIGLVGLAVLSALGVLRVVARLNAGLVGHTSLDGWVLHLPLATWGLSAAAATFAGRRLLSITAVRLPVQFFVVGLLSSMMVTAAIAVLQWPSGGLHYYFYKAAYTVAALAAVLGSAGAAAFIGNGGLRVAPLRVMAAMAVALLAFLPLGPWAVVHIGMLEPEHVDSRAVAAALRAARASVKEDVIVLNACRTRVDYTSRWTGTILGTWTASRIKFVEDEQALESHLGPERRVDLVRSYIESAPRLPIVAYMKQGCPFGQTLDASKETNLRLVEQAH